MVCAESNTASGVPVVSTLTVHLCTWHFAPVQARERAYAFCSCKIAITSRSVGARDASSWRAMAW
jgi:hypothetical protein